jgi:hypothetical protein
MTGEQYWVPLTQQQYEESRERRVYPDDVRAKNWYNARHISHPADALGCYAIEMLIEVIEIRPTQDMYSIHAHLLDSDGQKVGSGDTLFSNDGLIIEPGDATREGYLLDSAEELGSGPRAVSEEILAHA